MSNPTYFGLVQWTGSDIASTALTDTTNTRLLDAAAGHVWNVATGTAAETVWVTVNAVSPTATTATAKATAPAAAIALNAAGLLQLFTTPTGSAGGVITWGPAAFTVSPTGQGAAVVSATNFQLGVVTVSGLVSTGPVTISSVVSATGFFTTVSGSAVAGIATPTAAATDGFLYLPMLAATPSGTPTTWPGRVALAATSASFFLNPGATQTWTPFALPVMTQKAGTANGSAYNTTNTTLTDVDTANLAYTTVIPVGWKLHVLAHGMSWTNGSGYNGVDVVLFDTQGSAIADRSTAGLVGSNLGPFGLQAIIPGDGLSHTVKLQYAVLGGLTQANIQNVSITSASGSRPVMDCILTPAN